MKKKLNYMSQYMQDEMRRANIYMIEEIKGIGTKIKDNG